MPSRGETWIKTQTGWRTLKTIVIRNTYANYKITCTPINSDSESEDRPQNVCGVYWQSGPPFVILPGEHKKISEFFFISRNGVECTSKQTIIKVFMKLNFKQSIKSLRRFNYITKEKCTLQDVDVKNQLLEIVLQQDLISTNSSSQKKLLMLFEQLVSTVFFTELNVHIVKRLLVVFKERHLTNQANINNTRLWNHILYRLNEMERKIDKFKIKKLCKGSNLPYHLKLTDLPVEALRLILHCFSDHEDISRLSQVNRYFYKLTNEAGVWKSLCKFHLPTKKLVSVDSNIPTSWKSTYKKNIKRSLMRYTYSESLVICSHCHYIHWKFTLHSCSYDPKVAEQKVPILIPVTPRGFCHLFEK